MATEEQKKSQFESWLRGVRLEAIHLVRLEASSRIGHFDPAVAEHTIRVGDAEIAIHDPQHFSVFVPVEYAAMERDHAEDAPPLGQISALYVARYECNEACTELDLEPVKTTATVHVWPIVRERIRNLTHDFGWIAPLIDPWVTTPPMEVGGVGRKVGLAKARNG
jgi:hypothetical protein